MQLTCPNCRHLLDYTTDRPRFCSYCGQSLSTLDGRAGDVETPTVTVPPALGDSTIARPEADLPPGRVYQVGDSIGGYRLTRRIGAGAMGSVFEAEHAATGQHVAVKLIAPEFAMSGSAVERFRLEGRLASTITHPRCVFVLAADEDAGQPFIVMELMTGKTLATLVEEKGPLPPLEAIKKILDVIDGLREAHRLGVIHRDVKPSNCFVDARGRVKVGDFGLAKSVEQDGSITRTGTFLGTVVFSSPEQIKRERLDAQSDVYSVCATLYYLLTGKPPFGGGDALAAATRIVTEDPPSARALRPEVPPALDRVLRRGLERDKGKRWPDLDALRQALEQFLPGQLSIGGLGSRFVAHLTDTVVLWLLLLPVGFLLGRRIQTRDLGPGLSPEQLDAEVNTALVLVGMRFALWLAYYGLFEGTRGWSPGKLLMRLRVQRGGAVETPGLRRALLRSAVSFVLLNAGALVGVGVMAYGLTPEVVRDHVRFATVMTAAGVLQAGGFVAGVALMCGTMRSRNGYRGLHEFASDTRVLELARRRRKRRFEKVPFRLELTRPAAMPAKVGRFEVRGAVRWRPEDRTLLAHDPSLGRDVWVTMHDRPATAAERHRREVTRSTRLRWVGSGTEGGYHWDAWLAPTGVPLPAVAAHEGRLPWADAAPMLERLAAELAAGCGDGTIPEVLCVHQVWVSEEGRVQLIGTPLSGDESTVVSPEVPRDPGGVTDEARSVGLLREAAACMLEGRPRGDEGPRRYRAPVPHFALDCVNRLFPGDRAYASPAEFHAELCKIYARPGEVTRLQRFGHLVVLALLFVISIGWLTLMGLLLPAVVNEVARLRHESLRHGLEAAALADLAAALANPDPGWRLAGLGRFAADERLLRDLREQAERERQRRRMRRESASFVVRKTLPIWEPAAVVHAPPGRVRPDIRAEVETMLAAPDRRERPVAIVQWVLLLVGPAAWVAWAFATRGGLGLRLLGIELVRGDGRRASRWQCLLRALLFWAPVLALWGVSLLLEQHYWRNWSDPEFRDAFRRLTTASWVMWWAGAALLGGYFVYAVWKPERSLHDRLAGTWLVPR